MAIEDGVVLGRCLAGDDPAPEMKRYEGARQDRTARLQIGSRGNQWMKGQESADWLYGYDAWNAPLH